MPLFGNEVLFDVISDYIDPESKQKLLAAEVAAMMMGIIAEVEYLHQKNRVHRDIKPENIIVNLEMRTLDLIDYDSTANDEENTVFAGTKDYCSPPHYRAILATPDRKEIVSPARDIYALLTIFYYMSQMIADPLQRAQWTMKFTPKKYQVLPTLETLKAMIKPELGKAEPYRATVLAAEEHAGKRLHGQDDGLLVLDLN